MKKGIGLFLVISAVMALFIPVHSANAMPYFEDATIIGDEVNMRMRPTTEAPVIMTLAQGDRVGVFCEETEGWYRIIYGNYRGYISEDFVFLPSTDHMVGNVKENGLKVRQNPGGYSHVVATLSEGTGLNITNISGEWYYVEVPALSEEQETLTGYVHRDLIELSKAQTPSMLLKPGMSGAQVRNIQQKLRERGFLLATATGFFGDATEGAVKAFQKKAGLKADGVVGQKTYEILFSDKEISITKAELYGIRGEVKLSSWDNIKTVFTRGSKALVTDVRTGRKFYVKRFGGTYHADVEPLTKEDTAAALKNYGGGYSWDRRAIWVTVGSVTYAASMNFYPHGDYAIKDNNFPAHFCIHFKDSKLHLSGTSRAGSVCPIHQACVKYAYDKAR